MERNSEARSRARWLKSGSQSGRAGSKGTVLVVSNSCPCPDRSMLQSTPSRGRRGRQLAELPREDALSGLSM